jgi:class 3 adenylate cyclase
LNPYALPSFLAALPFAILGLGALLMNSRDRTTQLLSAMCLAFTLSGLAVGLFHLANSLSQASFWNRWPYGTILPGVLVIMEYCLSSSGRAERLRERWLGLSVPTARVIAVAILAGAWVLSLATDLVITTPQHNETTGWEHGYGPAFPAFAVALGYVLVFNAVILWRGFTAATDPAVRRFRLLNLLALGGGMALASALGFLLPGLMGLPTHSFAFLPLLVTIFLLTYGLMRLQAETIGELTHGLEAKVSSRTAELTRANAKLEEIHRQISRYLDPNVVGRIFDGTMTATLTHQRSKVTLFFSDIEGFTRFTDASDPDDVAALLNEYLGEMAELVRQWGGTIAQFGGDSVFAIFGAPESRGLREDALACVRMAVEMQQRASALRETWWNRGFQFPLMIRCGVNTGMANVGNYGSEGFMEFTAVGLNANLAARLEQVCKPGEIYLAHSTWGLVKDDVLCESVGSVEVEGFHEPVPVYRVTAGSQDGRIASANYPAEPTSEKPPGKPSPA